MNLHPLFPYQLYLVISEADCKGSNFLHVAEQAISGGVDIVQLREKKLSTPAFLQRALRLKEITDKYDVPLIINDNVDVCLSVDAAGIHVGNSDTPPVNLRESPAFKNKIIGYSLEYIEQLSNTDTPVADYLGISPVFGTPTKTDTVTEWGLDGVSRIAEATNKPLVAIGNMNLQNAASVIKAGAHSIAVVSAICAADDPRRAAELLKNEIIK